MKLKYYLRGLGIGIVVTTLILTISRTFQGQTMTDAQIMRRAEELGMILPDDSRESDGIESESETETEHVAEDDTGSVGMQQNPADSADSPDNESGQNAEDPLANAAPQENEQEMLDFTIGVGESTYSIAQRLAENGLVEDRNTFIHYMTNHGYASQVHPGEVQIPYGATEEEIAQILITAE
ncbi:MAG: hypothetical protein IJ567_11215 [Lachnospiraceae bacterium]|nr:hypothetical protein [Lachnospiraceae bacterium]